MTRDFNRYECVKNYKNGFIVKCLVKRERSIEQAFIGLPNSMAVIRLKLK